MQSSCAQSIQRFIRFRHRNGLDVGSDRNPRSDCHEIVGILSREIRDRADVAFAPQKVVREWRDVAHMNAAAHNDAAFADSAQRLRNKAADWREDDRCIERYRR